MRRIFLDDYQEDLFRQQGYIIQPFLAEEEVEELTNYYYANQHQEADSEFHATMGVDDAHYREQIDNKIKAVSKSKTAKYLSSYRILFSNFIIKESGNDSDVGVHQDWSYMNDTEGTSVNVWVPLVDTDESNGCLYVWPGSHRFSSNVRYTPYGDVQGKEVVVENAMPVRAKKGEAIIYQSGIFHFSGVNMSGKTRPAIGMVCIPEEAHSYHYFKVQENGHSKIEAYQVDTSFYYHYVLNQQPTGYPKVKELDAPPELNLYDKRAEPFIHNQHARDVGNYYDRWHEYYLENFGSVLQAMRPSQEQELLDYLQQSIGLEDGMRILDAGCGICQPAIHFGANLNISIDALTISPKQAQEGKRKIKAHGLEDRIHCIHGDFHNLNGLFPAATYDAVIFLESLGHAARPDIVLNGAVNMLKPGGIIYIKDVFSRETEDEKKHARIQHAVQKIKHEYSYHVPDINDTMTTLRRQDMSITKIQPLLFESDISYRRAFEIPFDEEISHSDGFRPFEWLEITCYKESELKDATNA